MTVQQASFKSIPVRVLARWTTVDVSAEGLSVRVLRVTRRPAEPSRPRSPARQACIRTLCGDTSRSPVPGEGASGLGGEGKAHECVAHLDGLAPVWEVHKGGEAAGASTRVPIADLRALPMMKSPSQGPGLERSAASVDRSLISTMPCNVRGCACRSGTVVGAWPVRSAGLWAVHISQLEALSDPARLGPEAALFGAALGGVWPEGPAGDIPAQLHAVAAHLATDRGWATA